MQENKNNADLGSFSRYPSLQSLKNVVLRKLIQLLLGIAKISKKDKSVALVNDWPAVITSSRVIRNALEWLARNHFAPNLKKVHRFWCDFAATTAGAASHCVWRLIFQNCSIKWLSDDSARAPGADRPERRRAQRRARPLHQGDLWRPSRGNRHQAGLCRGQGQADRIRWRSCRC